MIAIATYLVQYCLSNIHVIFNRNRATAKVGLGLHHLV